jgi:hypothetical protein
LSQRRHPPSVADHYALGTWCGALAQRYHLDHPIQTHEFALELRLGFDSQACHTPRFQDKLCLHFIYIPCRDSIGLVAVLPKQRNSFCFSRKTRTGSVIFQIPEGGNVVCQPMTRMALTWPAQKPLRIQLVAVTIAPNGAGIAMVANCKPRRLFERKRYSHYMAS